MIQNTPKHDSRAVANYFIKKNVKEERKSEFVLTAPVLEKIVLLVHAVHTAYTDKILCDEPVLYGKYEPYFMKLKKSLEYTDNNQIPRILRYGDSLDNYLYTDHSDNEIVESDFTERQIALFDLVWENLIKHHMQCHNLSFFTSNFMSTSSPSNMGREGKVEREVDKEATVKSIQEAFAA